ncbi:MAG: hypothetical protein NWR72_11840 [Bacteroidia bacterium]|nr:hypothetical protein [Bacteroidia bacterium]
MTKTILLAFPLLLMSLASSTISGKSYRFTAAVDDDFENSANWSPDFPGTEIGEEDQVILEESAIFWGESLLIRGGIRVEKKASLKAVQTVIMVTEGGWLDNRGKIEAKSLVSGGVLMNQLWSVLSLDVCRFALTSEAFLLPQSSLLVSTDCYQEGRLDIQGTVRVGRSLYQVGTSSISESALVEVAGDMLMQNESELRYHPQAILLFSERN